MEMRSSEVPDEGMSLSWLRRVEWAHEMGEVNEFVKVKDSVWLKVEDSAWYSISVPFEVRFQCSQFKQQRILTSYTASFAMRSLLVGVFVAILPRQTRFTWEEIVNNGNESEVLQSNRCRRTEIFLTSSHMEFAEHAGKFGNPPRPPASKRVDAQARATGLLPVN